MASAVTYQFYSETYGGVSLRPPTGLLCPPPSGMFDGWWARRSTLTATSPLSIASDTISIDLSAYAALAGAAFTGAVSGIAPTADANFATKKYVDDAIAALDDLSGVSF